MSITETLGSFAISLVGNLGYGGLAIGLTLSSMGILIPSEIIIPIATVLAKQGQFSYAAVFIVAVLAQTLGSTIGYIIGAKGGVYLVKRYGKYVLFSERDLEKVHNWYGRFGQPFALISSCLPVARGQIGLVSGIAGMPMARFVLTYFVGSSIWTVGFMYVGFVLADNLGAIENFIRPIQVLVVAIGVVAVGYYIKRHISKPEPK